MFITITKTAAEKIGHDKLIPFGYSEDKYRWSRDVDVDLSGMTRARCRQFRDLLATALDVPKMKARVADIDRWLQIVGGEKVRCKKVADFASMLKEYLKKAPNHWLYEKRADSEAYQPYYVRSIQYVPPQKRRDERTIPAHVVVDFIYEGMGKLESAHDTFWAEDCEDMTVGQALAEKGYQTETPELLEAYRRNVVHYTRIYNKVGFQVTAVGIGVPESERESYWYRRSSNIRLDRDGVPARLVVDVLAEDGKEAEKERGGRGASQTFWEREPVDFEGKDDDNDNEVNPGDEDDDDPVKYEPAVVPLAPSLMCFDLKRHVRLKVYVDQLEDYQYQTDLGRKLILPDQITKLVDLLVSHRGGFRDIIGDKSGGCIILCAGSPGTGKTLSAEVYSEAMSRPLYSVQCSQLGTDPDELEKELMKVFARAQRWGAILLLDEADVYVAARGHDLTQNAIVGVFLRTLEYYGGVLFMTTNRADLVDDAVASRCLARIDYTVPTPANQKRIWRVLADTAGIAMADAEIDKVVAEFPGLSGRDVKNLLKLAHMVAMADEADVTAATVRYVKIFKPTQDTTTVE